MPRAASAARALALALAVLCIPAAAVAQPRGDDEGALLVDEARSALRARDYQRAGRLLDRALLIDPRQLHVYVLRASVHGALREYPRGIAVMRRAHALAPDNLDVLTALGSQLVLGGQPDEGVPILERVVARDRRRYEALVLLGHHYAGQRRWDDAVRAFDGYLAARPKSLAVDDTPHRIARAEALLRGGRPDRARREFRAVLAAAPGNPAARMGLAWSTAAIDCEQALAMLRGMRDLEAGHPEVALVEGRCAAVTGNWPLAERAVGVYRRARPADAAGWGLAGEVRLARNDLPGAATAFGEAARRAPGDAVWALHLARVERLQGNPGGAITRLRAAGPPVERDMEWTVELAEALATAGKPDEVLTLLEPVAGRAPPRARVLLGVAVLRLGDPAAALGHLDAALAADPGRADARRPLQVALNREAVAAFRRGEREVAERLLTRAAATGDPVSLRNLGAVRLLGGDAAGAVEPLRKTVRPPGRPDAGTLQLLGRAYRQTGNHREAATVLRQAVPLASADPARAADLRIDLAGALLDGGEPEQAVEALTAGLGRQTPAAVRDRLVAALVVALRAASTQALATGAFRRAYKMLDDAESHLAGAPAEDQRGLRCDAALAATAAGQQDAALRRLRELARSRGACPFAAPADTLAVPILLAWAEGQGSLKRARTALDALDKLRRRATGSAEPLLQAAVRDLALRAASDSFQRGDLAGARRFLDDAAKIDRRSPEIEHDGAVLQLATGRDLARAVAALEHSAAEIPEAHLNLGIAADLQGKPLEALEHYRRAATAGVRHAHLKSWIEAHERVWGRTE